MDRTSEIFIRQSHSSRQVFGRSRLDSDLLASKLGDSELSPSKLGNGSRLTFGNVVRQSFGLTTQSTLADRETMDRDVSKVSEGSERSTEMSGMHMGRDSDVYLFMTDAAKAKESNRLLRNFLLMSAWFTANKACVTVVTSVAVSELGADIGGYNQAGLYGSLGLSSLFFANWAVLQFGPKWCLVIDCTSSFILMLGVTVARFSDNEALKYGGAVGGSIIAGTGIAWGWSGQGVYFGRVAQKYAKIEGMDLVAVSTKFGSYFAGIFLGLEVLAKVMATVIQLVFKDVKVFFIVYCAVALLSTVAIAFIEDMPDPQQHQRDSVARASMLSMMHAKASAVFMFLLTEPKMQLMAGIQFSFGFYMVFLNEYINASVTSNVFGKAYIGLFAALGAVPWVSMCHNKIDDFFGEHSKSAVLVLMTVGFCAIAAPFLAPQPADQSQFPHFAVFLLYLAAGVARSSYEFSNRSIVVDFFPNDKEAAMPCIYIFNSLATVTGFLAFPHLPVELQATVVVVSSVAGLIAYYFAVKIYLRERAAAAKYDAGTRYEAM
jgi:hypothetical protein